MTKELAIKVQIEDDGLVKAGIVTNPLKVDKIALSLFILEVERALNILKAEFFSKSKITRV